MSLVSDPAINNEFRPADFFDLPLERSISVDCKNPWEVDDGGVAIDLPEEERLDLRVHLASGGALAGREDLLAAAEEKQRSEYSGPNKDPLLPRAVGRHALSLDADKEDGVPALTFRFKIGYDGTRSDPDIYRSRVISKLITPGQFAGRYNLGSSASRNMVRAINLLRGVEAIPPMLTPSDAIDYTKRLMTNTNSFAGAAIERFGLPGIYRAVGYSDDFTDMVDPATVLAMNNIRYGQYLLFPQPHDDTNSEYYCHITSPLRRWPDLLMHLILDRSLAGLPPLFSTEQLEAKVRRMNEFYLERRAARLAIRPT